MRLFTLVAKACILTCLLCTALPNAACAKRVIVAVNDDYAPFTFRANGTLSGFDIDMWEEIAHELKLDFMYRPEDFSNIFDTLLAGRADLAVTGLSITDQRKTIVDFSIPYHHTGLRLLVRESEEKITDVNDLAGRIVACKIDTTSAEFATRRIPDAMVSLFRNIDDAFLDLQFRKIDAIIFDAPAVEHYAANAGKGRVKAVGPLLDPQDYAIAFKKNSPLLDQVNKALERMKQDGRLDRLRERWLGKTQEGGN
ncbi:glutamine transport system substrate-binding protein [Desulfobaculum xiamenense]|uniref:Glutamine transport system substrate-binding protein n=1 Tax=Desulfobaculum xiamenense TaxID=995050 RepID=A0A846QDY6_9BACT|nr:transporter substrate-binding domain-containing protein [Desulfobaculum xiamenense]NJB66588.1 glutamine transport system substrate-binding protein [Desulfobaculum xiamenense]